MRSAESGTADRRTAVPSSIVPPAVRRLAAALERGGERAYPVGGCVRDTLMGVVPRDWDLAVTSEPDRTTDICRKAGFRVVPTGVAHGTVTVLVPYGQGQREAVECTTCRSDGAYSDARHPDSVSFTRRIEEDLARRDFTVNAMALEFRGGGADGAGASSLSVLDPFGGQSDLRRRVIRCVGRPDDRFAEDALRMLRAVRFASRLGFSIEGETFRAASRAAERLSLVSRERVSAEFRLILAGDHPDDGLRLLSETGLLPRVLPPLTACPDVPLASSEPRFALRLAALLSDADGATAEAVLKGLRLPTHEAREVLSLLSGLRVPLPPTRLCARRLRRDFGELASDVVALRALLAPGRDGETPDALRLLQRFIRESREAGDCVSASDLALNGDALMALGVPRGRAVGEALAFLLDAVLEDPSLNGPERLAALLRRRTEDEGGRA